VLNGMRPYLPPDLDFHLRDLIQLWFPPTGLISRKSSRPC
jgi:hypothetical protein